MLRNGEGARSISLECCCDGPVRIGEEKKSGGIVDYDVDDRVIAIEVLDSPTRVNGAEGALGYSRSLAS
jgi:hypothetical protein